MGCFVTALCVYTGVYDGVTPGWSGTTYWCDSMTSQAKTSPHLHHSHWTGLEGGCRLGASRGFEVYAP